MVNTLLSVSPDGRIALSGSDEKYIAALGDATAKPGDAVGKVGATGKVVQCDIGVSELFTGFLMANRSDSISPNTAIGNGVPCTIVVPKSGHDYACLSIADAGVRPAGTPMGFSATPGALDDIATLGTAGVVATLAKDDVIADTYVVITWK